MKKTIIFLLIITILLSLVTGCEDNSTDNDESYNVQYGTDALQYSLFMNKQLSTISNQLSSQMIMANSVANGEYEVKNAIDSAKRSLTILQESRAEIERLFPPENYVDSRTYTLEVLKKIEDNFESYIKELENAYLDKEEISKYVKIMQSDFVALTAEFNSYNSKSN